MGLFSRKSSDNTPANPAMAELGRDYAIAERHGDRRAMSRIRQELGSTDRSDTERDSFEQGRQQYQDIPPAYSKPRRNRRR
ncbi:hypothetical protein [Streptomyces sp. NPDC001604]|uniref:hypothetical protein n=1 Tax=Streptomyces sp. NPDC001604 TaxID=3364593 RepID=UPI00369E318C